MKKVLAVIFLFSFLYSINVYAQVVPLDQKTWYSKSTRGAPPPVWGGAFQSYVDNNGLINPAGNACMQAGDAACNALMAPGPGAIWNIRVMDGDGATLADVHATDGSLIPTTDDALEVIGLSYGWEIAAGNFVHMSVLPSIAASFGLVNYNPLMTASATYGFDVAGGVSMVRIAETPYAATFIAANYPALNVAAGLYAFDSVGGANMSRLIQTTPADATTAAAALNVENFNMAWDATNSHWDRVRSDVNGALIVNQSTTVPGYGRIQDGDSTVLADVEDANADAKALTLNPLMTASVMYLYNGATIDMARNGAVKELQVTDVATRPGEDAANDWRKTKKQEIAVWTPAKEASGDIVAAATIVLASKEVVSWPNCCIYYRNKDAGVSLTDAALYTSPDNGGTCGDANWAQISWNDCETLAHGATCVYCFSEMAYRYVCGTASAAANPNDVDSVEAWITCNKS